MRVRGFMLHIVNNETMDAFSAEKKTTKRHTHGTHKQDIANYLYYKRQTVLLYNSKERLFMFISLKGFSDLLRYVPFLYLICTLKCYKYRLNCSAGCHLRI